MQAIRTKCRDSKNLVYVALLGEKKNCFTLPWYPVPGYLSFASFGERNPRASDDRHFPPDLEEGLCFYRSKTQRKVNMDLGGALLLILYAFSMQFSFSLSFSLNSLNNLRNHD